MRAVEIKNGVFAVLALIGAAISNALGGWDALLRVLVGMMAADYVTGIMIAAIWQRSPKSESGALDSRAGFKGLVKKSAILLLVYLAVLLDAAIGTHYIRAAVLLFYIGNEGLSLLENLCIMGMPHPKFLEDVLQVLRDKGDKGEASHGEG